MLAWPVAFCYVLPAMPAGSDSFGGGSGEPGDAAGDTLVPAVEAPAAEALVELNALLGRGTRYRGKLHFEGRVRIEGAFEGEIEGEDVLVIGEGASVGGRIQVGVCIVTGGQVRADIRARDAIELHAPSVVVGDLHAPNIFIDRGVQFEGSCKMAPLEADGADPSRPAGPQDNPIEEAPLDERE
jgi:cytoskeletal protein CcmA (bactofilin family)